ncbi:adenylate kinase 8 [Stomoxys calcitrans]|uniref:adenylate kinase 8 n=1 Tax=Stomoxys calcitrans TaxID=35570 RepID=UPI0027E264DC|nr:adenylate kinase 8 [Stomoxys calcitrans]
MSLQSNLAEYAAELMVYFEKHKLIEISKRILVECALERPDNVPLWMGKNIKRIAASIYQDCLNQGKDGVIASLHLSANFLYRVVFFGRRGSGRKTQAIYLARRFNLVYLNAENLIHQYLRGDDKNPQEPLARELQRAFYYNNCKAKSTALAAIISKRLLDEDCLTQGWVLVNFPHTTADFRELLENFKIPPNKVVYLQCPEEICMSRLLDMPNCGLPSNNRKYFEQEMWFYKQNEIAIDEYLSKRHETIYVNGSGNSQAVKNEMFAKLEKTPYIMGCKQDTWDLMNK